MQVLIVSSIKPGTLKPMMMTERAMMIIMPLPEHGRDSGQARDEDLPLPMHLRFPNNIFPNPTGPRKTQ
jgi:hypothetical protein